jgi:hypothetical protein
MLRRSTIALGIAVTVMAGAAASAQDAPPGYVADPDVYKRAFEDTNFRITSATWQPGQSDKPHSTLATAVAYALTDCSLRVAAPDGKFAYINVRAGGASTVARTVSHTTTNVGTSVCHVLVIERK